MTVFVLYCLYPITKAERLGESEETLILSTLGLRITRLVDSSTAM